MKRPGTFALLASACILAMIPLAGRSVAQHSARMPVSTARPVGSITIDYPFEGSVFPPEFPAPTVLWREAGKAATVWVIEVTFSGHPASIKVRSRGEGMPLGEIDPRCVAPTNKPPQKVADHAWTPNAETWAAIKRNSANHPATITITGYGGGNLNRAVSRGQVSIQTSTDPVGAPIFYRDVPLMPSETKRGVIKPLAASALPLIAWRLRNVAENSSRVVMEGLHTCANCHSVSLDGKTMGMDLDGPLNDKGLYAIAAIQPQMSIRDDDVVSWSTFRGNLGGKLRVGFMSQVSPDGQRVVTTISDTAVDQSDYQRGKHPDDLVSNYYVANFKDYRFLQVFYPTRGILAWYDRAAGRLQPLPGADDPRYVQTNAVWSPDGRYLVFARAQAKDAYPSGARPAESASDPNETQIQYDLYRIPFNGGAGGRPEPIAGASQNGMSNSFPKVSPDGRWIVYVQCRNGQLMRPDSQLYIVPAAGGRARRMTCNTPLMNSWHSFSPNGRWLVFSSKSLSPYTQMFLTHIDEAGNDSPAILIENATAANRAVNIPEFVNIPPNGLLKIDVPAADYYRIIDIASELAAKQQYEAAIAEWKKALQLSPEAPLVHFNLANALGKVGRTEEAVTHYEKVLANSPDYAEAYNNLGSALVRAGKLDEAIPRFEKALEMDPENFRAHINLAAVLGQRGRTDEAIAHAQEALKYAPDDIDAHNNLGLFLTVSGRPAEAIPHLKRAVELSSGHDALMLNLLSSAYADAGRFAEAIRTARQALAIATRQQDYKLVEALKANIASYQSKVPQPKQ